MASFLNGRVAIVTGAGRGIGREHALETPAQEVVRTIKERGGEAVVNTDNVADFRGAKRLIDQAVDTFGSLDILVNNAGILRDRVLVNMVEPEWDAVIEVHLKGTFAPSRHASAYWRNKSKEIEGPAHGRIINTSSVSGLYGNTGQTNYGAAKAGIAAFTIIAARELKRYGVTVNAVAPQALTRMTEGLRERTEEEKRAMDPARVSPTIVWLASLESSDFTGRIVEAGSGILAIAEGWHRGPTIAPEEDPTKLGPILLELQAKARKNAGMNGVDLD